MREQKYSDTDLIRAISESKNFREVKIKLGCVTNGSNDSFKKRANRLNISTEHFCTAKNTDEQIVEMIKESTSLTEVARKLGLSQGSTNYNRIARIAKKHQVDLSHTTYRKVALMSVDTLNSAIQQSKSFLDLARRLGLSAGGGVQGTLKRRVGSLNLSTKHFTGQGHRIGSTKTVRSIIPLDDILTTNSTYNRTALKKRMIAAGMLILRCDICDNSPEWNKKPLTLRLDHINGINTDNRVENLRLVCPNCDSQLPTYCGRNKKRG